MDKKGNKRYKKPEDKLEDILIYHKRKYIMPICLILYLALVLVSIVLTLGVAAYAGEEPPEVAKEIFRLSNMIYLLPGMAVLGIPALLIHILLGVGERRFLRVYRTLPETAKQKLFEAKFREHCPGNMKIYEAEGCFLFYDGYLLGMPQIVRTEDIVWGYLGRSDVSFPDREKNIVYSGVRFFFLCFYTKDGRRHRIFANVSYKDIDSWFTARCPRAILGYGREQRSRAEEIFRAEAERAASLFGEERDFYPARRKRAAAMAMGGSLMTVVLLAAGFGGWQYRNSEEYLYRKNMRQAESWYESGEFSRAYQAYYAAREIRKDDKEALKGMLLSSVETAKKDGYLDSIIRDYENLFYHQELFAEETDISGWYFECAEYYLMKDDPVGAAGLLERGIETFEKADAKGETAEAENGPARNEEIIGMMERKKEDILAHCRVAGVTEYLYGERREYKEYDEQGREVLHIRYPDRKCIWEYKNYDEAGNLTFVERWEQKEGEKEKQKTGEEYLEYDEQGNLYYIVKYDTVKGKETYEMNCGYDEEGYQNYYLESYDGEIFTERQCYLRSDHMQIDREYTADCPVGEEPIYYIAQEWDEKGKLLRESYYSLFYSPEEIHAGEAAPLVQYDYAYDENGNTVSISYISGSDGRRYQIYEREYDNRNNLIKEIYYEYGEEKNSFCETTVWKYNEEGVLLEKEVSTDGVWKGYAEHYAYDEAGNLIRRDYLDGDGSGFSVIKEYDILGNPVKEYRIEGGAETLPDDAEPEKEWEYKYRYLKKES